MTRVAVLGDGLAAAQIGAEYALGGCSVLSIAPDREAIQQHVEDALRAASQHGLAGPPSWSARERRSLTVSTGTGMGRPAPRAGSR